MKSLDARLADLTPAQRALVEQQLQRGRAQRRADEIGRRAESGPAPLSFAQELVYRIERGAGGSPAYHVPRALRIAGPLDVDHLRAALDALVERHHVLRTTFSEHQGELVAHVNPARSLQFRAISLATLPAEQRAGALARALREAGDEPFDLAHDLLLRATLVRFHDNEHVLFLLAHHIAWDLGSHDIALAEIAEHYARDAHAGSGARDPLRLQYADFAAWERRRLRGDHLAGLLDYWRAELAGVPEQLALPTDAPRQTIPTDEGLRRRTTVPADIVEALITLAARFGTTAFVAFAAAFATLLYRLSGDEDVVLGCAVAGRTRPELEPLIGYFANMLPLRARFSEEPTFARLLGSLRATFFGALEHAEIPYEKLALELAPRSAALSPLFNATFDLRHDGHALPQLGSATLEPMTLERCVAKFDLSLTVVLGRAPARGQPPAELALKGRAQLFAGATLDRMLRHFVVLLRSITANPDCVVSRLPLFDGHERAPQIFAKADIGVRRDATIDSLIAAQAAHTPTAVALQYDGETRDSDDAAADAATLTYAQLGESAARVTAQLRALGVKPGVGVALLAERSPELVIGMLGVLAAGGHYVPIDPAYPTERIAFMLDDAGVSTVLTLDRLAPLIARITGRELTVLSLDALPPDGTLSANVCAAARHTPDDLAYVIYTSGSTGRPKGVMVPHKAVANYLTWMRAAYAVTSRDVVLQRAPASFDASVWELFLPLVAGARLVLARRGAHGDPTYLVDVVERRHISLLQLVPSQLPPVLDAPGGAQALTRLRRLFLGGEALPGTVLGRLLNACPTLAVTNLYGPTEATVYATHWDVDAEPWDGAAVPLGTPISGVTVDVRDRYLQLVPLGVKGEVCIGGAGLADGYVNRPEMTGERFVNDPVGGPATGRLYRTGDLARYTARGTLEFLGRLDTQVKLRGLRVELGEIESTLAALPEVAAATVLLREDVPGDARLVAYCIPASGDVDAARAQTQRVRAELGRSLPAALLPTAYVWLERWPLSANGKLDRAALPQPDIAGDRRRLIVAPRTATEAAVAQIWTQALSLADIGVTESFFELGGHSLTALRILAQIEVRCGVHLPLNVIFERPTVAEIAAYIDERAATASPSRPALRRTTRTFADVSG